MISQTLQSCHKAYIGIYKGQPSLERFLVIRHCSVLCSVSESLFQESGDSDDSSDGNAIS